MTNELYLQSNDGTLRFDMMDDAGFCLENEWDAAIARELEARPGQEATVPVAYAPVTEQFNLYARVTDANSGDLHVQWKTLLGFKETMRRYRANADAQDYVWLYVRTDQGLYRSLVQKIDIDYPSNQTNPFLTNGIWYMVVRLIRHPFWESPELTVVNQVYDPTFTTTFFGKQDYQTSGDVLGRILDFTVRGKSLPSEHQGYYAGWKRGSSAGWVWWWDCYRGTNGTDCTDAALTGSRAGTAVRCTFATDESFIQRLTINLEDAAAGHGITADFKDNRGTFLVLLRYYATDATSSYSVRARYGVGGNTPGEIKGNIQYIDGETTPDFKLLPLDVMSLPWGIGKFDLSSYNQDTIFKKLSISIDAQRFSGAGYLWFDSIWFIPIKSHLSCDDIPFASADDYSSVQTLPNDTIEGIVVDEQTTNDYLVGIIRPVSHEWGTPSEPSALVILLDNVDHTGDVNTLELDATITYCPRYLFVR